MRESIDRRISHHLHASYVETKTDVFYETVKQPEAYFAGHRTRFEVPLLFAGTVFQQKVWERLLKIPYGQTISYAQLSAELGDPGGIRAVAAANGANAMSILVPCHRVIATDGSLTGYAGGLDVKKKLLRLEKALPGDQLELFTDNLP